MKLRTKTLSIITFNERILSIAVSEIEDKDTQHNI
jgi:hypothetical protein